MARIRTGYIDGGVFRAVPPPGQRTAEDTLRLKAARSGETTQRLQQAVLAMQAIKGGAELFGPAIAGGISAMAETPIAEQNAQIPQGGPQPAAPQTQTPAALFAPDAAQQEQAMLDRVPQHAFGSAEDIGGTWPQTPGAQPAVPQPQQPAAEDPKVAAARIQADSARETATQQQGQNATDRLLAVRQRLAAAIAHSLGSQTNDSREKAIARIDAMLRTRGVDPEVGVETRPAPAPGAQPAPVAQPAEDRTVTDWTTAVAQMKQAPTPDNATKMIAQLRRGGHVGVRARSLTDLFTGAHLRNAEDAILALAKTPEKPKLPSDLETARTYATRMRGDVYEAQALDIERRPQVEKAKEAAATAKLAQKTATEKAKEAAATKFAKTEADLRARLDAEKNNTRRARLAAQLARLRAARRPTAKAKDREQPIPNLRTQLSVAQTQFNESAQRKRAINAARSRIDANQGMTDSRKEQLKAQLKPRQAKAEADMAEANAKMERINKELRDLRAAESLE